jgi:vesicle coat complex subunit
MTDEKNDEKLVKIVVLEKKESEGKEVEQFFDLPKLFQQLKDKNPETREKAIHTLADCAWIRGMFVKILYKILNCLKDENEKVRGGAADAITKYIEAGFTDPHILLKLVEQLEDKSEYVKKRVADAIIKY